MQVAALQHPDTPKSRVSNAARTSARFPEVARSGGTFPKVSGHGGRPWLDAIPIQPKLAVGSRDNEFEREADRVADEVMRMPEPRFRQACPCGGGCPRCQTLQSPQTRERRRLMRLEANGTAVRGAPPLVHEVLSVPGQPLDQATRAFMEPRFGCDLQPVRVHTDASAGKAVTSLGAQAFTHGNDIYFIAGKYQPQSNAGRHLLAHELTHAIQQGHAPTQEVHNRAPPSIQRSSGEVNILQLDEMFNRVNVPEVEVIALLGRLSPSERQHVLINSLDYKSKLVASLGNTEMARAVDALGAELAVKLDWMAAEGTDYDLVKPRIQASSSLEQLAVLNNHAILASLRDGLWSWDGFAKCVELLGRQAPDVDMLIADAQVQAVLETAWGIPIRA